MERLNPEQLENRRRVELGIAIASPLLDAVMAVGERISRIVEPVDHGYYPVRSGRGQEHISERSHEGPLTKPRDDHLG